MAEYTKDSGIGERMWNATKAFVHNGIKGAAGGMVMGAIIFAATAYFFPAVVASAAIFGLTDAAAAITMGAGIGAASMGLIGAGFGALNELVKPPVDRPLIQPPEKARVISRAEARALEPAIEVGGAEPPHPAFTDRVMQERLRMQQQSHTIH